MSTAFSTPPNRIKTLILFVLSVVSAIASAILGIDDNPPGILLAFLAAIAFVLAFVHPWQTPRRFLILVCASVLGTLLFIILNNAFASVGHNSANPPALQKLAQGFAVAFFFLGTLICPAAFIVGAVGWIVTFIRSRYRPA